MKKIYFLSMMLLATLTSHAQQLTSVSATMKASYMGQSRSLGSSAITFERDAQGRVTQAQLTALGITSKVGYTYAADGSSIDVDLQGEEGHNVFSLEVDDGLISVAPDIQDGDLTAINYEYDANHRLSRLQEDDAYYTLVTRGADGNVTAFKSIDEDGEEELGAEYSTDVCSEASRRVFDVPYGLWAMASSTDDWFYRLPLQADGYFGSPSASLLKKFGWLEVPADADDVFYLDLTYTIEAGNVTKAQLVYHFLDEGGWMVVTADVTLTWDAAADAIRDVSAAAGERTVTARYGLGGQRVQAAQRGLQLQRMSDGTVRKVCVR